MIHYLKIHNITITWSCKTSEYQPISGIPTVHRLHTPTFHLVLESLSSDISFHQLPRDYIIKSDPLFRPCTWRIKHGSLMRDITNQCFNCNEVRLLTKPKMFILALNLVFQMPTVITESVFRFRGSAAVGCTGTLRLTEAWPPWLVYHCRRPTVWGRSGFNVNEVESNPLREWPPKSLTTAF